MSPTGLCYKISFVLSLHHLWMCQSICCSLQRRHIVWHLCVQPVMYEKEKRFRWQILISRLHQRRGLAWLSCDGISSSRSSWSSLIWFVLLSDMTIGAILTGESCCLGASVKRLSPEMVTFHRKGASNSLDALSLRLIPKWSVFSKVGLE